MLLFMLFLSANQTMEKASIAKYPMPAARFNPHCSRYLLRNLFPPVPGRHSLQQYFFWLSVPASFCGDHSGIADSALQFLFQERLQAFKNNICLEFHAGIAQVTDIPEEIGCPDEIFGDRDIEDV